MLVSLLGIPVVLAPATVSAAATIQQCLAQGSNLDAQNVANGCSGNTDVSGGGDKINNIVTTVINIFSVVVGVVAVIMIIFGGFRYITSGGDSTKVTGAKNTIIYALIGLVVVALAQFIVQFVLNKVTSQ